MAETTTEDTRKETSQGTTAINLDITGPDLMLSGSFQDWDSGVSMGPDLDQLQVRLAIDATSATAEAFQLADTVRTPPLFAFRGRHAVPLSAGVYQVDGELTSATGAHSVQVIVETPIEHSAVFLLSFQARKSDLGAGWTHLLSNLVPFTRRSHDDTPTKPAHGWLTLPTLAAA
ncbi:MAG TPA: hypothetical protein VFH68_12610 [Polyangia bacterium]|nr:hypothetical protein [Polyangia bacterium]